MEQFLAAKEQIIICNSVLDEEIAERLLQKKGQIIPVVHEHIRQNFALIQDWFFANAELLEWHPPRAGVVCFPRVRPTLGIDMAKFHEILYHDYQTVVGAGHWFEQPAECLRIGFGYPTPEELLTGLENIRACLINLIPG